MHGSRKFSAGLAAANFRECGIPKGACPLVGCRGEAPVSILLMEPVALGIFTPGKRGADRTAREVPLCGAIHGGAEEGLDFSSAVGGVVEGVGEARFEQGAEQGEEGEGAAGILVFKALEGLGGEE